MALQANKNLKNSIERSCQRWIDRINKDLTDLREEPRSIFASRFSTFSMDIDDIENFFDVS